MLKVRWLLLSGLLFLMTISAPITAEELTLDDCIKLALKHNMDVIRARSNLTMAENNVWQAVGDFLPNVSVNLSMNERHDPKSTYVDTFANYYTDANLKVDSITLAPISGETGGMSKSYTISGGASMTLFNGGQNIFNYTGAQADRKYYAYIAEESEQSLIYNVKVYYFAYLRSLDQLEISKEAVKRGEEQYKLAKSKYEVGSASKSDVLKAQVQFGNDKLGLIEAENGVLTALADFKYLIGLDISTNITVSREYQAKLYSGTQDEAQTFGVANHPGLQALKYNLKAAKTDLKKAWGSFLPTWSVSVNKYYSGNTWGDVSKLESDASYWSFGSTISLPIFQGFARKAAVSNAKALLNDARASLYYSENNVTLKIDQSYRDIKRYNEALKVAEENVLAAEEDMSIVREKYNLGAATILEVLDAQVSLIQAQNSKVNAEFDYNLAVANLEKAMGIR